MPAADKTCPFSGAAPEQPVDPLSSSEAHYRAILEAAVDSIITINEKGVIQSVNAATTRTFGFDPEELLGRNIGILMPSPFSDEHDKYIARYLSTGVRRIIGIGREVLGKRKDGSVFPMELSVSEVNLPGTRLFTGIVRDITDRKLVEEALLAERNRVQQYLDITAVGIISLDPDGRIQLLNRKAAQLFGLNETDVLGHTLNEIIPEENSFLTGLTGALLSKTAHRWKSSHGSLDSPQVVDWYSAPLTRWGGDLAGILVSGADITELSQAQDSLKLAHRSLEERVSERTVELSLANEDLLRSVKEKEVLLKEIHHRVKNNLQLISSLLNLQVRARKGMTIEQLIYEIQGRIQSIALLHEMLYQTGDLVRVDIAKYIKTLAETIIRYYGMNSRVELRLETENLKLSLDGSIYCGLLLNELITNAMKHAFPAGRNGVLTICARREPDSKVLLSVKDNGVGLPEDLDIENTSSLGLELVQQLTAKLHGALSISRVGGTGFELLFEDQG